MYTSIKYLNTEKTMIAALREDGIISIIEPMHGDAWSAVVTDSPEEYVVVVVDPRDTMTCSPAQIRLALLDMGLLAMVQAMADADPSASIVWEYATTIYRMSPLIDGLKADAFTDAQIDDIFAYAQGLLL